MSETCFSLDCLYYLHYLYYTFTQYTPISAYRNPNLTLTLTLRIEQTLTKARTHTLHPPQLLGGNIPPISPLLLLESLYDGMPATATATVTFH